MKNIFALFALTISINAANLDPFFAAIGKVESSNNPKAINKKENALGIYQIRPGYFKDSNIKGEHNQVFNPIIARKVCESYFKKYAPKAYEKGDFETLARLHNGGPSFVKRKSATDIYWAKVKKNLDSAMVK
jgi:soluble lytic murein transglycosylase-like protein